MSVYIHGTSPEEQRRLTLLNTVLLNEPSLKELALAGGEKILDVGSGLGQFSRAMAKKAGRKVLGVEQSEEQIREAVAQSRHDGEESLVEFRQGDARDLPLSVAEWGSFDLVHTRFVLEHIPDPLSVVRQMVRAARSGGRIVLADDDHENLRLYPEVKGFGELWNAYQKTFRRAGNDPAVGRKLVALLHDAGAAPTRATWIFFGACRGESTFEVFIDNLAGVVAGAREQILEGRFFAKDRFDTTMGELRAWRSRPDATLWYAVSWAEGKAL